jgi:hypothetical protein
MSIPLWAHPLAQLALTSVLLLAFRLGAQGERVWHVRFAWVAAIGLIAFAFVGLAAHAYIGFESLILPHGWLGAIIGALLLRQIWLGRFLQQGDERERKRHRLNARVILLLVTLQILSGLFYASTVI